MSAGPVQCGGRKADSGRAECLIPRSPPGLISIASRSIKSRCRLRTSCAREGRGCRLVEAPRIRRLRDHGSRPPKAQHDLRRSAPLSALRPDRGFACCTASTQRVGMGLPRKLRRRTPRRWAGCPDDLHDYTDCVAPRRASVRKDGGSIAVTDDWPEQVPIGDAELRAIEGHMRQELDKLFGPLP